MKKETLVKILITVIMIVALLAMSINVFAATSLDGNSIIDLTNTINTNTGSGNTNTGINLNTGTTGNTYNTNINTNIANTNNVNTNLPHTGVAENTLLIISIMVLGIVAIYAYTRIKYYKNI